MKKTTKSPASRPLALAPQQPLSIVCPQQAGVGLLTLIIALALSTAVVGVAYTAYSQNKRASTVASATSTVRNLNRRVMSSYSSAASFRGLTNTSALHDKVYPAGLLRNGVPGSIWSSAITLSAINLNGGNDNGFALTYDGVDPDTCTNFVINAGQGFYDVKVNGTSAMTGRKVLPNVAAALCSQVRGPSVVQFIQAKGSPQGIQNPTLNPPCAVVAPQTRAVACPGGQVSSVSPFSVNGIAQRRDSFCAGAYGAAGWTPWIITGNTCSPTCATRLPTAPWLPSPATKNQTVGGSAACPAGQVGSHTWTQGQSSSRAASCANPALPVDPTWGAWSGWANVGGRIGEVNTCSPTCATRLGTAAWKPNPDQKTRTVGGSAACPLGYIGSHTWSQAQTSSRTASCASPGTAIDPTWGGWSAWANSGGRIGESNSCAKACVAPGTTAQNRAVSCPSPQTGSIFQTQTTSWSCPAPTGAARASVSPWTTTRSTCANPPPPALPPPPAPTSGRWNSYDGSYGNEGAACGANAWRYWHFECTGPTTECSATTSSAYGYSSSCSPAGSGYAAGWVTCRVDGGGDLSRLPSHRFNRFRGGDTQNRIFGACSAVGANFYASACGSGGLVVEVSSSCEE